MNTYHGIIEKGEGRGKPVGFPTINIPLSDETISGIYAGIVRIGDMTYASAIYVNKKRKLLEAHLLDVSKDFYGENAIIQLFEKIRDDMIIMDSRILSEQIAKDVGSVKNYFASHPFAE